jgi:hypothetical protein
MEMVPLRLRFLPSRSRYSVLEVGIEERKANSSRTDEIRAGVQDPRVTTRSMTLQGTAVQGYESFRLTTRS